MSFYPENNFEGRLFEDKSVKVASELKTRALFRLFAFLWCQIIPWWTFRFPSSQEKQTTPALEDRTEFSSLTYGLIRPERRLIS